MSASPEPSSSSSLKRGLESSPCHESSSSDESSPPPELPIYFELPSPEAIKRRKIELYEEFAAKDPGSLSSRCTEIEKKLDRICSDAAGGAISLSVAMTALESANQALERAQRLQSTTMEAVETAKRALINASNLDDLVNRIANIRRVHTLQAAMTKRDWNKKAVEERQSAVGRSQNDLEMAEYELQQSEMKVDEELGAIDEWDLEFINEDESWSSF